MRCLIVLNFGRNMGFVVDTERMRIFLLTILVVLCNCSVSNPWAYNAPPGTGMSGREALDKPVVLLAQFTAGTGVDARWSDIAPEMQQAFARALLKTGKFDVVTDQYIVNQALDAIADTGATRDRALDTVRSTLNTNTAFLVQARITDFLHTSEAPDSVRRLSWFSEANDAVVAMDMTATDLQVGRVAFSDQIAATVGAGDEETDQYGSLEFGSYLFWSTPLGRASTDVLDEGVHQLAGLRGSTPGVVKITAYEVGHRDVKLSGDGYLDDGGIYYVGAADAVTGQYISIDDDLGRALRLRVEKHFFGSSTGWLLSEPAEYEHITGATLSKAPLPTQATVQ